MCCFSVFRSHRKKHLKDNNFINIIVVKVCRVHLNILIDDKALTTELEWERIDWISHDENIPERNSGWHSAH